VQIKAELAGNLWKIVVREGQQVRADETLMILESMKMEIPVNAASAGRVAKIHVKEGQAVQEGQLLIEVE
jgi:acetyl-CoA carboxylase biotin carboxyl carrier protein